MASIWTLPELDEQLAAWKAALLALSTSQSYEIGGRKLTRADLPEVRRTLDYLAKERALAERLPLLVSNTGRPCR